MAQSKKKMVACSGFSPFSVASGWEKPCTACRVPSFRHDNRHVRYFGYKMISLLIISFLWQYSDDREIEIDNEIIDKEETDYRERGKNRRKHLQALVPSEPDNRSSGITVVQPSFVMDQPNKKQTWLYDTPGVINEKQV